MIDNIGNFIGQKVRIIVYKNNEVQTDMITRKLDKVTCNFFSRFKYIGHHITPVTQLIVIELIATDDTKEVI